jgi:hypothetical protein
MTRTIEFKFDSDNKKFLTTCDFLAIGRRVGSSACQHCLFFEGMGMKPDESFIFCSCQGNIITEINNEN